MPARRFTADQMARALKTCRGMVYLTAEQLGCDPKTVYNYINRYPSVAAARDYAIEGMLDWGEVKLFERVMAGDVTAIKYLLSTKGKDRGYTEQAILTLKDQSGVMEVPQTFDAEYWEVATNQEIEHAQLNAKNDMASE